MICCFLLLIYKEARLIILRGDDMTVTKEVPVHRIAALLEYATSDAVYGITREDRKILDVLHGVNDLVTEKE